MRQLKMKQKNEKVDFFYIILGNALSGRGIIRASEGAIRAGQNF